MVVELIDHIDIHSKEEIEIHFCFEDELHSITEKFMEYQEIADAVADVEKKFKGEGRVLIRPSGPEPLVRVMIEGKDQKVIDEEARKLAELITKIML